MPNCFAETTEGLLLIASGMSPVLRWNGQRLAAEPAGVLPPTTPVTLAGNQPASLSLDRSSAAWYALYQLKQLDVGRTYNAYSTMAYLSQIGPMPLGHQGSGRDAQNAWYAARAALSQERQQQTQLYTGTRDYFYQQYEAARARELSGITAPSALSGTYYAYVRYKDVDGNYSNPSPLSKALVAPATGTVTGVNAFTAPITVTAPDHGLATGTLVSITGVSQLSGGSAFNAATTTAGPFAITVVDEDTFTLDSTPALDFIVADLSATWSAAWYGVRYTDVPVPLEPKVKRRQILRNTAGQTRVFYVDVDTEDLISTTFDSAQTDAQLQSAEAVTIIDAAGVSHAFDYSVPPNHKSVFAAHQGRMFAAVDVEYTEGAVVVTAGSTTVTGIGTEWTDELKDRFFYCGGDAAIQIASVDRANQTLTLLNPYTGSTDAYAAYAIRPAPAEARLLYWALSGLAQAWPPWNALPLQEDGDEMTGLMSLGSFLYILEKRHIYRFTFQSDPATDGFVFLAANRGCINFRSFAIADDVAYMLDEGGVFAFAGGEITAISDGINDLFWDAINWKASRYFHAVHFPAQNTVYWFVALAGSYVPRHALVYDYAAKAWSTQEFARPIASSCLGLLNGHQAIYLGSDARTTLAYQDAKLDGPDAAAGTVEGDVAAAGPLWLSDTAASYATAGIVGNPVAIVSGKGKGQVRRVVEVDGQTIRVDRPWLILPDTTSVYRLGAINWTMKTGRFRFVDSQTQTTTEVRLHFRPTEADLTADLRLYYDRRTEPEVMRFDSNRESSGGIAATAGSADLVVALQTDAGYVKQAMDRRREERAGPARFVALELRGFSAPETITLTEIEFDGVRAG